MSTSATFQRLAANSVDFWAADDWERLGDLFELLLESNYIFHTAEMKVG